MNFFSGMDLTSLNFFVFLFGIVCLYYIFKKFQKYILGVSSLAFYFLVSDSTMENRWNVAGIVLFFILITYGGGLLIGKATGGMKKLVTTVCVLLLVSVLFVTKYMFNLTSSFMALFHIDRDVSFLQLAAVIGISYFALSAIGYLIEVAWELHPAEKNLFTVILFVFYFPQIISGPVTRYPMMKKQFEEIHELDWNRLSLGIRRMLWGYFKKLVISERFAQVVKVVYSDYGSYNGLFLIGATLCYAVQLYTDFSGCMDIIMGASEMFAIQLPENFNAPFMSQNVREFWQRWHITLGTWFKDFVMYPIQKSKAMISLGKLCKKRFGKKVGKKVPFYIAMAALWGFLGIWHGGTGYYFVASAGVPFLLLMASDLLEPVFSSVDDRLHIKSDNVMWCWIKRIRTLLLICICWIFVCAGNIKDGLCILSNIFVKLFAYMPVISTVDAWDLGKRNIIIMLIGFIILIWAEITHYKGKTVFECMDERKTIIKWGVIYIEALIIMCFGMVGSSSFIYFKF